MGFSDNMNNFAEKINNAVGGSFVGRFFEFENRQTTFLSELRGATATFMSMAYILAVNPRILSDSGGPCVAEDGNIFSESYIE
jgi:AGZA family xanthine/uracil permease-like MFS transporter